MGLLLLFLNLLYLFFFFLPFADEFQDGKEDNSIPLSR